MVTLSFFFDSSPIEIHVLPAFALAWALAAFVITVVCVFIGLPLTWFLYSRGLEKAWTYPLAGALIGTPLLPLLFLQSGDWGSKLPFGLIAFTAASGAIPGAVAGAIWWHFGRRPVLEGDV
jgi:hypothetical protein